MSPAKSGPDFSLGVDPVRVDVSQLQISVSELIQNPDQIITLDANFFLPPDRREEGAIREFSFEQFQRIWLDPFFTVFKNLAIHEAVKQELVSSKERAYAEKRITESALNVFRDTDLSPVEMAIRNTKERLIAPYTSYVPALDNKDDRGEVKSLAYLGAKGYIYFASNDRKALRLVDEANRLKTSLDDQMTIKFYEGIYLLRRFNAIPADEVKWLYKYLYCLTKKDKVNPGWGEFNAGMEKLYC